MRRIRLVVVVGVVMAAMLALSAGPAMADDFDGFLFDGDFDDNDFDDGFNETLLLAEGTPAFEQWCSPGLPDGIFIPGCIFSDPLENDDIDFRFIDDDDHFFVDGDHFFDGDVVLLVDDDDHFFDDGDRNRDHPRRHHNR